MFIAALFVITKTGSIISVQSKCTPENEWVNICDTSGNNVKILLDSKKTGLLSVYAKTRIALEGIMLSQN